MVNSTSGGDSRRKRRPSLDKTLENLGTPGGFEKMIRKIMERIPEFPRSVPRSVKPAWKRTRSEFVSDVTPELAQRFRNMPTLDYERKVQYWRIQAHIDILLRGEAVEYLWVACYVRSLDKWLRINGQHSSITLSELKSIPPWVTVARVEYEVDTLEDANKLYAAYDSAVSVRQKRDIARAVKGTTERLADVPETVVNKVMEGLLVAMNGGRTVRQRLLPSTRIELIHKYSDFAAFYQKLREEDKDFSKYLNKASVVAAIFNTWDKAKKDAWEFWSTVCNGLDLRDKNDPRYKLRKTLQEAKTTTATTRTGKKVTGKDGTKKVQWPPERIYCNCLWAWNFWRDGAKWQQKRFHPTKPFPRAQ